MKCPVEKCQIQCSSVLEYLKHCQTHGNKYQPKYPCDKCDQIFASQASFYRHIKEKHKIVTETNSSALKILTCSHCMQKFNNFESFRKHAQTLYPSTRITCPCCSSQLFITYNAFYKHFTRYHEKKENEIVINAIQM